MNSFSTRQPRIWVLCASVAVSTVLFSGIASTFQHAGSSVLCTARLAQFKQTQASAQTSANAGAHSGNPAEAGVAQSRLAANGMKISAKL